MSDFTPTAEQAEIQEKFSQGGDGVIEAFAGTGKTTTFMMLAENDDRRGIIVTYNSDAAKDANAKLVERGIAKWTSKTRAEGRVTARTTHSLAFSFAHKNRVFNQPRVPAWKAAQILGIPNNFSMAVGDPEDPSYLEAADLARLAIQTVKRYCHSADENIGRTHVPNVPGAEPQREEIRDTVMPYAAKVWADALNPNGKLYYDHDYYLKAWALSKPVIRTQFLLLDEAQDTNPVFAHVFASQNCQKVAVGDRFQAIYGWRGAVDAMSNFDSDWRLALTQSWRFGQAIADEANKLLALLGSEHRVQGNPAMDSTVEYLESPKAVLCRTNASCIAEAMAGIERGQKVALAGGEKKVKPLIAFIEAAEELMDGGRTKHPELVAFSSWEEVVSHAKDEEGADLRVWVKLIEEHGTVTLTDVCNQMGHEEGADLVVSTAHSAKGREWETVKISPDFKEPTEDKPLSRPEAMLLYVALTRGRNTLDPSAVSWIDTVGAVAA